MSVSKKQKYQTIAGLLSTQEAADELGITPGRVKHLVRDGRLRASKIGRLLVFKLKDLEPVRYRPLSYLKGKIVTVCGKHGPLERLQTYPIKRDGGKKEGYRCKLCKQDRTREAYSNSKKRNKNILKSA